MSKTKTIAVLAALICSALLGFAATAADQPYAKPLIWQTLGTQAGPFIDPSRSEAANLLLVDGKPILVDCGAGVLRQLMLAGFAATDINTLVITHLHQDHISGLGALLGLRWQQSGRKELTIYGPPGTDIVVNGLLAAMQPALDIAKNEVEGVADPNKIVHVKIIQGGDTLNVDGVDIKVAENTHFNLSAGTPAQNGTQSLAYRFSYKNEVIGFTGDTGPCPQCVALFQHADLLVSEVLDLPKMASHIKSLPMPELFKDSLIEHFRLHHLTPQEAGALAEKAAVKALVLTHIGVPGPTDKFKEDLIDGAHQTFKGPVLVAHDLDKF